MSSKVKQQKEVVCRHEENIIGSIGTCRHCDQQKEYKNGKFIVLKRGMLRGKLTMVTPPVFLKK